MNLKRGTAHNEMTIFRYDVTLHLDTPVMQMECEWLNFSDGHLDIDVLRNHLETAKPSVLGVCNIPNSRVAQYVAVSDLIRTESNLINVGDLRKELSKKRQPSIDRSKIFGH